MYIKNATPLFPLGSPRSGTTILAKILNAHPKILMTDETSVILQISENIKKSKIGRKSGVEYGRSYPTLWAEHLTSQAGSLIEDFYEKIRDFEGKEDLVYWGEKHPHHSHQGCLEFIENVFPTARYIYIVRDPRDVALSISKMRNVSFIDALNTWKKFADNYEAYFKTLDKSRYTLSLYEDLVGDYKGRTNEIMKWLSIPNTEEVESFIDNFKDVDVHAVGRKVWQNDPVLLDVNMKGGWAENVLQRIKEAVRVDKNINFGSKSVNKWKQVLSSREKKYATSLARDYIEKYGYELG